MSNILTSNVININKQTKNRQTNDGFLLCNLDIEYRD